MNRLKELRIKKGQRQVDVARALNLSRQTYNFYENGKRDPDTATLVRMADYFGVSTDYLLGRTIRREQSVAAPSPVPKDKLLFLEAVEDVDSQTIAELHQFLNFLKQKNAGTLLKAN